MAYLVDEFGNRLIDESGNPLTDDIPTPPTTFPLMLMMRLRLHAAWLPIGLLLALTKETGAISVGDGTPIGLLLALTRVAEIPPGPEPEPPPVIAPSPGGVGGVAPRYKRLKLKKKRKREELEELLAYLQSLSPAEAEAVRQSLPPSTLSLLDGLPAPRRIVLPQIDPDDEDEDEVSLSCWGWRRQFQSHCRLTMTKTTTNTEALRRKVRLDCDCEAMQTQPSHPGGGMIGSSGVVWILPSSFDMPSTGCLWDSCDIDGALPLSVLPNPAQNPNALMRCSNSDDPVWTGTASHVGKPIRGGGTHKVLARWNGTAWCIAG
jgi:hypothetical protein